MLVAEPLLFTGRRCGGMFPAPPEPVLLWVLSRVADDEGDAFCCRLRKSSSTAGEKVPPGVIGGSRESSDFEPPSIERRRPSVLLVPAWRSSLVGTIVPLDLLSWGDNWTPRLLGTGGVLIFVTRGWFVGGARGVTSLSGVVRSVNRLFRRGCGFLRDEEVGGVPKWIMVVVMLSHDRW